MSSVWLCDSCPLVVVNINLVWLSSASRVWCYQNNQQQTPRPGKPRLGRLGSARTVSADTSASPRHRCFMHFLERSACQCCGVEGEFALVASSPGCPTALWLWCLGVCTQVAKWTMWHVCSGPDLIKAILAVGAKKGELIICVWEPLS